MKLPITLLFLFMIFYFFLYQIYQLKFEKKAHLLDVQMEVENIDLKKYGRLNDLFKILIALRAYRDVNHSYPISTTWSRRIMPGDSLKHEVWIKGLVPEFIKELPYDPRDDGNPEHQYGYISNGAHFKLVAFNTDDCKKVEEEYPQLISGLCHGYGFWSSGAGWW